MEDHENRYDFELYDLDNVNVNRPSRGTDDPDKIAERCVLEVLCVAMGSEEEMMVRSFRLIAKNRDFLFKKTFISLSVHKQLEGVAEKDFGLKFIDAFALMQTLDYRNSFTCFFVHLFNSVTDQRKKVIVFDNLDAISVEHLSIFFLASFSTALWNANNLAQSDLFEYRELQFTRRFKFIFCLREANFECINAHLNSRLNLTDELPLKFSMETQHFREIVEHRLGFYQKLNEYSAASMQDFRRVRRWFDAFLGDEYFNRVFVPLYNRDYRASVSTLLVVAEASSDQPHWDNFMEDKAPLRGILFFHMTKELRIHNFLKDYVWSPGSNNGQARPYCYLERMLLTTVLNYRQMYSFDDIDQAQTVSLGQLIRDLRIAYTLEEILTSVAKCFLYHRRDWAHLITIQDKEVHSEEKFVREMSALYKRDPAEMDKVRIRLNSAGFIFLRYLLPHFEFYSMMSGNGQALYQIGLGRRVDEAHDRRLAFDFEFALEKAFDLARLYIKSMNTFFKLKFEKTLPPEDYRASRFAFKHFGSGGPQSRGYFQSTRIITAHIGYIDKFRLFTLT